MAHIAVVVVPAEVRVEYAMHFLAQLDTSFDIIGWYRKTLVPMAPPEAAPYMPTALVDWLEGHQHQGRAWALLSMDFRTRVYEWAQDLHCVGGMGFITFWNVYWPFLFVVWLIFMGLPQQRVRDETMTWREVQVAVITIVVLLVGSF